MEIELEFDTGVKPYIFIFSSFDEMKDFFELLYKHWDDSNDLSMRMIINRYEKGDRTQRL